MGDNIKIFLIDKNKYTILEELKKLGCSNIEYIKNIDESIDKIKKTIFQEMRIIINGKLFSQFIEKFEMHLTEFFSIPKIVIFTENEELFLKKNKDIIKKNIFKFTEIKTSIEDLKKFINDGILNQKFELKEEPALTFKHVERHYQLALHLFYKVLIKLTDIDNINTFTNKIYEDYKEKSYEIRTLLGPIRTMKYIPIELLAKYYARAYTAESDFYRDMNYYLRTNTKENQADNIYLPYIKLLYESIKLKTFPLVKEKELYRGTLLSKDEIKKIENEYNNKIDDLPGMVLVSKTFLSFSKDKNVVLEQFLKNKNTNNNLAKVLFILKRKEEDTNYNYNLATHADIEKISYIPIEKEVLFFPFSSFEISGVVPKSLNGEMTYEINLLNLGQKDVEILEKHIKEKEEERKRLREEEEKRKKEEEEKKKKEEEEKKKKEEEEKKKIEEETKKGEEEEKRGEEKREEEKKEEEKRKEIREKIMEEQNDKINKIEEGTGKIKNFLEMEKIEDFEFKSQITESGLVKLEDITSVEELLKKYKLYKKSIKKFYYNKGANFIKGKINITDYFVNKKIKIISCFEQYENKYYSIKQEDLDLYKNLDEIKMNTSIKINNKAIKFSFFHTFKKKGEYDIEYIFKNSLTKIDYMFSDCKALTYLDFSNFDNENVINMSGLFNGCLFLQGLNLTNIDTEEVFDMSRMFYNCKNLTKLDLSYFNTINVVDMRDMFYNCIYIDNLNLSNFITNNVQNMSNMFNGCKSLAILNLTNFNVDKVAVMWKMFHGCINLQSKSINNKSLKLINELKNVVFF